MLTYSRLFGSVVLPPYDEKNLMVCQCRMGVWFVNVSSISLVSSFREQALLNTEHTVDIPLHFWLGM